MQECVYLSSIEFYRVNQKKAFLFQKFSLDKVYYYKINKIVSHKNLKNIYTQSMILFTQ